MADLSKFKEILKITSLNGMNTNYPQGFVRTATYSTVYQWRPYSLENADFSRPTAWACQPKASLQLSGLNNLPIWAGAGDDLFLQSGGAFNYYDGTTRALTPISGVTDAGTAVLLMPGLAMTTGYNSTSGAYSNQFILKGGASAPASASSFTLSYEAAATGETGFVGTFSYDFVVITNGSGIAGATYFQGAKYAKVTVGAGVATLSPYVLTLTATGGDQSIIGRVYWRKTGVAGDWQLGGYNPGSFAAPGTGTQFRVSQQDLTASLPADKTALFTDYVVPVGTGNLPTAYHLGRVWISGANYRFFSPDRSTTGVMTGGSGVRLLYSEIIAAATMGSLPRFRLDNYIDVPFKISKQIVAIKSAGRYLYVFGDRELFILSGNSDKDFNLESLGDSLGAISIGSVQRLGNTVIWAGESGVMKVDGGTVTEIGEDIRPNLQNLDPLTTTSSVNFNNDTYFLGDATTKFVYFSREDAWTKRTDGVSSSLFYGGGTPYSTDGSSLYALDGRKNNGSQLPGWLPLIARWSPHEFDGWNTRKEFRQVLIGYESVNDGLLTLTTFTADAQTPNPLTHTALGTPYAAKIAFNFTLKGYSLGMTLTLAPSTIVGSPTSLLRPPLHVIGIPEGEQP